MISLFDTDVAGRFVELGVDDRKLFKRVCNCLENKRQEAHRHPDLSCGLLCSVAQGHQLGDIDLFDVGEVNRRRVRSCQALCDTPAHPAERNRLKLFVRRRERGGCRSGWAARACLGGRRGLSGSLEDFLLHLMPYEKELQDALTDTGGKVVKEVKCGMMGGKIEIIDEGKGE